MLCTDATSIKATSHWPTLGSCGTCTDGRALKSSTSQDHRFLRTLDVKENVWKAWVRRNADAAPGCQWMKDFIGSTCVETGFDLMRAPRTCSHGRGCWQEQQSKRKSGTGGSGSGRLPCTVRPRLHMAESSKTAGEDEPGVG